MKHIYRIICCIALLNSYVINAQEINLKWNNYKVENEVPDNKYRCIELNGNYYCIFFGTLVKLDKKLKIVKKVSLPDRHKKSDLDILGLVHSDSKITVVCKYLESKKQQNWFWARITFNEDLEGPINIVDILNIDRQASLTNHFLINYSYNSNRDVVYGTIPKNAFEKKDKIDFTFFNNSLETQEDSYTVDFGTLAEVTSLGANIVTPKREFFAILNPKQEAFKKVHTTTYLAKYSKEDGMKTIEIKLDKNNVLSKPMLYMDTVEHKLFLTGFVSDLTNNRTMQQVDFLTQVIDAKTLEVLSTKKYPLGSIDDKCVSASKVYSLLYSIEAYNLAFLRFNSIEYDYSDGKLLITGEMYTRFVKVKGDPENINSKGSTTRGRTGAIMYFNIDIKNEICKTTIIPHEVIITDYDDFYSGYFCSYNQTEQVMRILMYDDPKNTKATCDPQKGPISINDKDVERIYLITIDKNNQAKKVEVTVNTEGIKRKLKRDKIFEIRTMSKLAENKYMVYDEMSIGIMTIDY